MTVKGIPDIPQVVVEAFKEAYPYAGGRLEFHLKHVRGEVLRHRMLLNAFYYGYKAGKEVKR